MNRSVTLYYENLEEGILSKVGGHLKRNWGKYALGAGAALGASTLLANPGTATTAGIGAGKALTSAGTSVGGWAGNATKALGGSAELAGKVSSNIAGAGANAGKALTSAGKSVGTFAGGIKNKMLGVRPAANPLVRSAAPNTANTLSGKVAKPNFLKKVV
jgi:hypothetical protein